jgi:hypothetical protein
MTYALGEGFGILCEVTTYGHYIKYGLKCHDHISSAPLLRQYFSLAVRPGADSIQSYLAFDLDLRKFRDWFGKN